MKKLFFFIFVLLAPFQVLGVSDTLFYLHRIQKTDVDPLTKIAYIDSLLKTKKSGRDTLLLEKVELAYNIGYFNQSAETYKELISNFKVDLSLSEELKYQLYYIHGLHSKRLFYECIVECMNLLRKEKPDSLRYYDAMVECMLVDFNKQNSVTLISEYISKNEKLLNEAIKGDWPKVTIDNIKFAYYTMLMKNAIQKENFDEALKYTDYIEKLPLTANQKDALSINVAYIYMRLGKNELAEDCLKDILKSGMTPQRRAIALLNYSHLLNSQNRYQETLELIEKYNDLGLFLNHELYGSYLLGNKALALSNLGKDREAFETLMSSKILSDSIYNKSGIQDGLLMLFDQTTKAKEMDKLENKLRDSYIYFSLTIALALIFLVFIIKNNIKLRKFKQNHASVEKELADKMIEYSLLEKNYLILNQERSGKIAAQLLPETHNDEALAKILVILKEKNSGVPEKLKMIEDIIGSLDIKSESKEMFEHHFEQAHSLFFKRLYTAHPDITQGEARICAYLIMNLSNKEIANITNKSVRSVESTRYRISKKIDLPEKETLITYLRSLLN